jgi:hypothetical protein
MIIDFMNNKNIAIKMLEKLKVWINKKLLMNKKIITSIFKM